MGLVTMRIACLRLMWSLLSPEAESLRPEMLWQSLRNRKRKLRMHRWWRRRKKQMRLSSVGLIRLPRACPWRTPCLLQWPVVMPLWRQAIIGHLSLMSWLLSVKTPPMQPTRLGGRYSCWDSLVAWSLCLPLVYGRLSR